MLDFWRQALEETDMALDFLSEQLSLRQLRNLHDAVWGGREGDRQLEPARTAPGPRSHLDQPAGNPARAGADVVPQGGGVAAGADVDREPVPAAAELDAVGDGVDQGLAATPGARPGSLLQRPSR